MESSQSYSVIELPASATIERTVPPYVVIVPLYMALIAGTGGIFATSNIQAANEFVSRPLVCVVDMRQQKAAVSKVSDHISRIRQVFGLTMSDVAVVFGVTRPTAYAWLHGAEPRQEMIDKMWTLSSWADDFERMGLYQLGGYLHRPLFEGKTLYSLLSSGSQLDEALVKVCEVSKSDAEKRKSAEGRGQRKYDRASVADFSPVITEIG